MQQQGQKRAVYGQQVIKQLAEALTAEFGKGYSKDTLKNCRKFYLTYRNRISEPAVHLLENRKSEPLVSLFDGEFPFRLSWTHYLILMRIDSQEEREFYEQEAFKLHWGKRELQRQYNSSLYERLLLSKNKNSVMGKAQNGKLAECTGEHIKDPYVLEFLGLAEKPEYSESEMGSRIIDHLQEFLMEMGKGFTFVRRQVRFSFDEKHFRVDLVLYNRLLRAFVLIDLKAGELKHQDLGQIFFRTVLKLTDEDSAADLVTVTERLRKDGWLEKVGGITFVAYIANCVPTAANIRYHAKIAKEMALLRRLIEAGTEMICVSYERNEDVEDILDKAQAQILSIASLQNTKTFSSMEELLLRTFQRAEELHENKQGITGLSTGFPDLDRLTYGLSPSDFIIVAARPSMGKTAFALNIATHVALHQGKSVAFFSLEMAEEQLSQRILCAEAMVDSGRMQTGNLTNEDWDSMIKAGDRLSKAALHIDDTAGISVMELRTKARRLKAEQGLDLIVIDYLQLMQGKSEGRDGNRQQEISGISRSLKALARELKIPVIALSQLSRSVESRPVKRPLMSDLRESGSLEQDADLVMLLYREDYYEEDTPDKNIAEVIVAKHRNGPVGTVRLFFQKEFTRFMELVEDGE